MILRVWDFHDAYPSPGLTVIITVSLDASRPSETVSLNVRAVETVTARTTND